MREVVRRNLPTAIILPFFYDLGSISVGLAIAMRGSD